MTQMETDVKMFANGVEKPSMRVDLFLIFGFEDEDDLYGYQIVRVFSMWKHKLRRRIHRQLCGILVDKAY